jgi:hypothetical protein
MPISHDSEFQKITVMKGVDRAIHDSHKSEILEKGVDTYIYLISTLVLQKLGHPE